MSESKSISNSTYVFLQNNIFALIGGALLSSIISQSLQDFFVVLIIVSVIWKKYKEKKLSTLFDMNKFFNLWLLFLISSLLVILFRYGFNEEYLSSFLKFKWIIMFFIFQSVFKDNLVSIKHIKKLIYFSAIPAIYVCLTMIFKYDFLQSHSIVRAVGMVNSATYYAHAAGVIFVFYFVLFWGTKNQDKRAVNYIYSAILLIFGLSIYYTYTRGIWGSVFFALFICLFQFKKSYSLMFLICTLISVFVLIKTDPMISIRMQETFNSKLFDKARVALFKSHLEMFKDYPIFGIGYDVYKDYNNISYKYSEKFNVPEDLNNSHSHNQYLQLLSMTGIVGFFCFFIPIFYIFFKTIKYLIIYKGNSKLYSNYIWCLALFAAQIEILIGFLTDQSFEYAKVRIVILIVLAASNSLGRKMENLPY